MKLRAGWAVIALAVSACGLSTGPSDGPFPEQSAEIELAVGEERSIPGTSLRLRLLDVVEDSRCPVDVTCVWEGNAAVEIGLAAGSGPTHVHVLHTVLEPRAVDFGGVRVTLVGVAPEPHEGEPIPAEDYVASLRVEPIELAAPAGAAARSDPDEG